MKYDIMDLINAKNWSFLMLIISGLLFVYWSILNVNQINSENLKFMIITLILVGIWYNQRSVS